MLLKIVNYCIKILIVLLGVLLASGVLFPSYPDKLLIRAMGVLFIFWGVYRIIVYTMNLKKYRRDENEEESR